MEGTGMGVCSMLIFQNSGKPPAREFKQLLDKTWLAKAEGTAVQPFMCHKTVVCI
jgi:hypothetical protein